MRASFAHLDEFRVRGENPAFASPAHARYGAFQIPIKGAGGAMFIAIADDGTGGDGVPGTGWEHVSVRVLVDQALRLSRVPTWNEISEVKRLFWKEDEVALQFMVDGSGKANVHSCVLHLWRPCDGKFPMPDPKMV
jgi:hypothetical protein